MMANMSSAFQIGYMRDPVLFVREELRMQPTEDQARFLREAADLKKLSFIITAGRGSGKTLSVAWLICWAIAVLPEYYGRSYTVTLLSGSAEQASWMYKYFTDYLERSEILRGKLLGEPTKRMTKFKCGSWVKVLTASMKQAAGPHPDMLIVDEVCIAEERIVRKALLQAVGDTHGRTILLSTPSEMFGLFRDYWTMAADYGYSKVGPWPLTNCPWVKPEQIEFWRRQFPPDYFTTEILGEFATAIKNVFALDAVEEAFSHGTFGINPNYPVFLACDWGKIPPSKTVLLSVQVYDGMVWICGPERHWQYEKYPDVQRQIKEYTVGKRIETFYGDSSHTGENERIAEYLEDVRLVNFSKWKAKLADISIFLFWQRRIRISADMAMMKRELLNYSYEDVRGRTRYRKGDDDYVDALTVFCSKLQEEGFETHRDVQVKVPAGWGYY